MSGAARPARDDLPAGHSDMHRDPTSRARRDSWHRLADGECRERRPLCIIAVGHRRAEHAHDAVADVLVDGAAMLLDDAVDDRKEALEQLVHLLRVQLPRERGVVDEVGKEHRHLSPLAGRLIRGSGLGGCRIGCGRPRHRCRPEQPFPVAHRNAELLQVGVGQLRKDVELERVGGKELGVLL